MQLPTEPSLHRRGTNLCGVGVYTPHLRQLQQLSQIPIQKLSDSIQVRFRFEEGFDELGRERWDNRVTRAAQSPHPIGKFINQREKSGLRRYPPLLPVPTVNED
jgi:hypothetical protein